MPTRIAYFLTLAAAFSIPGVWAQTCQPNIRATTPTTQFIINAAKGTVLDTKTGLMWKRCVEGRSGIACATGSEEELAWGKALSRAASSTHAGYKDWRLPNAKDLLSLVEAKCYQPAINAEVFPNTQGRYHMSSTLYAANSYGFWTVGFAHGDTDWGFRAYGGGPIRLVRGGH